MVCRGFRFFVYWIDIALTYLVASKKNGSFKNIIFPRRIRLDYYLNDNDPIPFFSDWKVVKAAGHTASDISIWHPETNRAYIADNLVGSKTNFYRPYPLSFPSSYKNSLSKYMELGIEKFMLAHTGEHTVPYERLEELIRTTPKKPRIHRTNLAGILGHLAKAFLKR